MNYNARISSLLVLTLVALSGCSSDPAGKAKKAERVLDRIQGKAQVTDESGGAMDAALNAGGHSVYLWEGMHRYRLFLKTPVEVDHGKQYVAEGINAQKAIDEIGDADSASMATRCRRAASAWSGWRGPCPSMPSSRLRRWCGIG